MELRLQVPLLQKELQGHMEGSLMETKAPVFNQVLAPYTRFAIKAGYIDKIEFQADIVNSTAKGTLSSEYKDLSIEVTTKGGKKSKLLSLLGNLVIENDNKQGKSEASQTVSIQHVHQQENNMVNFVWGTLRDGLLKTIKPEIVE
jgi:hypothetical protein